jgi:hypothetical protein
METLPPPILLRLITFLDVATIHNLHLTSHALHHLLATHAPPRRLQRSDVMRLAASNMVAWAPPPFPAYAVDDPIADEYREYIAKGLEILWAFADITDTVPVEEVTAGFCGLRPRETTLLRRHEDQVLAKRLEYVRTKLTAEDVFQYEVMCMAAFSRFLDGATRIADHDNIHATKYGVGRKNAWFNWYLLRYGPPVLLKLWNTDVATYVRTVRGIDEAFEQRQKAAVKIERKAARELHEELKKINPNALRDSSKYLYEVLDRFNARQDEEAKAGQEAQYKLR